MRAVTTFALGVLLLVGGTARAQRGVDANLFRPSLDSYGIFTLERADVSHQFDFGFKLAVAYAGNPLRAELGDLTDPTHTKTKSQALIDRLVLLDLGVHLGLTDFLELAFDFPVAAVNYTNAYGSYGPASDASDSATGGPARTGFYQNGGFTNIPPPNAAPLDARLALKARFFRKGLFGLGAAAIVTLPFGDDSAFLGDTGFTFQPKLIADVTRGPITATVNVGAILRQETRIYDPYDLAAQLPKPRLLFDVGHELTWGLGLAYRFVHWVGFGAEVYGYVPLVGERKDYTADVIGGLQLFPTKDLVVNVGAGANVFTSASRHDDYRVFLGITWAPVEGKGTTVVGGLDSDNDGVPDAQDACPNEPEDRDGFQDEDGCPDPDNDQDGIFDQNDKCPNDPEDRDGFQDQDGCPETDNDQDGIPDAQDKCPNDPEDRDGFQDDDGCPDADNDGDGIPDQADKCPNEPETFNGVDDADGCPDSGGTTIVQGGTRVDLPEVIGFAQGSAGVDRTAAGVLDKVAEKLRSNAHVKRVRIEGHADDPGGPKRNEDLSQKRAEAVRDYLIKRGVEPERLQAVGYGSARPVEKAKNAAARAKNRRVEFIVVEQ